ncbi:161_t:CDS:2 [Paraglomus occultum]|uniref:161_t:CDS:1 n=1 Tax=Paraglomus occultum TaxID=144539 RepID=A0A9N9CK91_9GLOM|nr:161_t:CDS:2 [Paraglomus occultum]
MASSADVQPYLNLRSLITKKSRFTSFAKNSNLNALVTIIRALAYATVTVDIKVR